MLNIQALKINPFTEYLVKSFERTFGTNDQEILNFLRTATSISLENIANGDMLYHNIDHTIMVASVGSEIIRGKHLYEGGFCAEEGLAFLLALLCHDVGYVKGVCRNDDLTGCAESAASRLRPDRWLRFPVHTASRARP